MSTEFEMQVNTDSLYQSQRYSRLTDVIDEYLNYGDVNPKQLHDEMLSSIDEIIAYHTLHLTRAETFRKLITPQPCPTCDPTSITCQDHLGE